MTDVVETAATLPAAARDALVNLVVRGMVRGQPSPDEAALVEYGLAAVKGPVVMPIGRAAAIAGWVLRVEPGSPVEARGRRLLEAFLPVNRRLRDLCTAWQCRPDGSANDHSDAGYDAQVRDGLDDVHESIVPILDRLSAVLPRFAPYAGRLQSALDTLDSGDPAWLASPLCDSYHTVWMHLHQELLLTLGVSREEDEQLEERLVARVAG